MNKLKIFQTALVFILFLLPVAICAYVVKNNAAPWVMIGIYWYVVSIKNMIDFRFAMNNVFEEDDEK